MTLRADMRLVETVADAILAIRRRGDAKTMRQAIDAYLRGSALALTRERSPQEAYRVLQQAADDAALAIIESAHS